MRSVQSQICGGCRIDTGAVVRAGVARIPEDRHAVGVVGDLPLWENAVLERYATPAFARLGFVRRGAARVVRSTTEFCVGAPMCAPRTPICGCLGARRAHTRPLPSVRVPAHTGGHFVLNYFKFSIA